MGDSTKQPPAGWYPDPAGGDGERFWDGGAWSQSTRDKPSPVQPSAAPVTQPQPSRGSAPYAQQPGDGRPYQQHPQGVQQPYHYAQRAPMEQVAVQGGHRIASFWWRLPGYLIDMLLVSIVNYFITYNIQVGAQQLLSGYVLAATESMMNPSMPIPRFPWEAMGDMLIVTIIGIVLWAAYRALTVGFMNATLGQKIFGLRVARLGDEELSDVGWNAAVARGVWGGVLYQFIGFFAQISVLFTGRKQTIPDLLSKTVVVNTREELR